MKTIVESKLFDREVTRVHKFALRRKLGRQRRNRWLQLSLREGVVHNWPGGQGLGRRHGRPLWNLVIFPFGRELQSWYSLAASHRGLGRVARLMVHTVLLMQLRGRVWRWLHECLDILGYVLRYFLQLGRRFHESFGVPPGFCALELHLLLDSDLVAALVLAPVVLALVLFRRLLHVLRQQLAVVIILLMMVLVHGPKQDSLLRMMQVADEEALLVEPPVDLTLVDGPPLVWPVAGRGQRLPVKLHL